MSFSPAANNGGLLQQSCREFCLGSLVTDEVLVLSAFQELRFDVVDLHCSLSGHALPLQQPRKGPPGLIRNPLHQSVIV